MGCSRQVVIAGYFEFFEFGVSTGCGMLSGGLRDVPLEGGEDFVRSSRVLDEDNRGSANSARRSEIGNSRKDLGRKRRRVHKGNSKYRCDTWNPDKGRC